MTSHDSVNFALQFKILLRFLEWKIRISEFSNSHTWNSTILANFTNYFHDFSHFSCQINSFQWLSYFRSMFSTSFQQFLFPKSVKLKEFDFDNFEFWPVLKQPKCTIALKLHSDSLTLKVTFFESLLVDLSEDNGLLLFYVALSNW